VLLIDKAMTSALLSGSSGAAERVANSLTSAANREGRGGAELEVEVALVQLLRASTSLWQKAPL
jgi:hypothetical protein